MDERIDADRRRELLDRIARQTATIGQQIPEQITVDGEPFDLRAFVVETKSQGGIPPERREAVRDVRQTLKAERERRRKRLESAPLAAAEAEDLVDVILGLDRAISALGNLAETDLAAESHEASLNGTRRWVEFVDQLTE